MTALSIHDNYDASPSSLRPHSATTEEEKLDLEIPEAVAAPADQHPGMANMLRIGTNTGVVTSEEYITEDERCANERKQRGYYKFRWASLWQPAEINPLNGKSMTFPVLRVIDPYATAFWLATLGFFTAFVSWFAFSPLVPEAVKNGLHLSANQVTYSNMASLGGTAIVRFLCGPACDRYGPRKVLATLLIVGALPSGLAAVVSNIQGLETVRFFISLLGATFVPTQAYTSVFFDKTIIGTANAFAGGWANMGGGASVAIMISTYDGLKKSGLSSHLAWRLCFLVIPVPSLLLVAAFILLVGKDHPAGKWSQRHQFEGTAIAITQGQAVQLDRAEMVEYERQRDEGEKGAAKVSNFRELPPTKVVPVVDIAQPEPLTLKKMLEILANPRIWMCSICYLLTFGLETAMDAALPGLISTLFTSPTFSVDDAAYVASLYGLLNIYARPLGGVVSDVISSRFGLRGRVIWLLSIATSQGIGMIGLGLYCNYGHPTVAGVCGFIVLIATSGFAASGAVYSLPVYLAPANVGTASGLVGALGNVGGLCYTAIFLQYPGTRAARSLGTKFWIAGTLSVAGVLPFFTLLMPGLPGNFSI